MRSKTTMAHRQRLLWTALLLSCSTNTAADRRQQRREGGVRRRRRQPQHDHDLHRPAAHHHPIDPHAQYHPTYRRLSTDCPYDQKLFLLSFQTDSYGSETSWFLRSNNGHEHKNEDYIGFGPPSSGPTYGDFTLYSFSYCLTIGSTYTLAMEDNFGDGMCCTRGFGGYEYSIGGVRLYSTYLKPTYRDYVEHTFTVEGQYSPAPTDQPTEEPMVEMECVSNPGECGCEDVEGEDYRGTIATTEKGLTCQAWSAMTPHAHEYLPASYPEKGLTGNYCRSPDGGYPWCMTTDPNVEWGYCRIPTCPTVVKVETQPPTQPLPMSPLPESPPSPPPTTQSPTWSPVSGPTTERPTLSPVRGPSVSPSLAPTKPPTPQPTLQPTPKPTPPSNFFNPLTGCFGGDINIKVEARADEYSNDTSWELTDQTGKRLMHQPEGSFKEELEYKSSEMCVPPGNHTFEIRDKYGDGMCCRYGEGFFKVHLNDREVLNGGSYNENITTRLNVGYEPDGYMTERESLYLEAHNVRRKEWHERYDLSYVPLVYSPALAKKSKAWAEELLHACGIVGIEHEDHNPYGENLAKNTGNPESWGQLYPPTKIVGRWVDHEIGLPYPSNGHLTQALWRASKYLGCGESVKKFRNGVCRVQVCRYGRAGNCDMTRYNSTQGENWLVPMLDNYTRCGPDCPPEGCF